MKKHLLIVGSGSVGKRHARNFTALGCTVSAMDPRSDRLAEIREEAPVEKTYESLEHALERSSEFSGVVVCSPPSFHVAQCEMAMRLGLPIFLEKPVCPDLDTALELHELASSSQTPLLLGYTYRWWPPLLQFKSQLAERKVGRPLYVDCTMSAHLADWHPWENYWEFFMASAVLGGGALLDESHFVDLLLWFFGMPQRVYARVEKLSSLKIDTDDSVDALLIYDSGLRAKIHLDLYGRPHEKYIRVTGEEGSLHWSFDPNVIRYGGKSEQQWDEEQFALDRNDMFVNAAREFIDVLHGATALTCTLSDGVDVLRVLTAMRRSSEQHCEVAVI